MKIGTLVGAVVLAALSVNQPAMAKSQDTVKYGKWEALGKGYLGRPKEVDAAILQANLAGSDPAAEAAYTGPVYSLWLETGEQGAYQVPIADLADGLAVSEQEIRDLASEGKLILKNEGKNVGWHFDEANDSILFTADAYETFYTDKNAFQFALSSKAKKTIKSLARKAPNSSTAAHMRSFTDTLHFEVEEGSFWGNTWAVTPEDDNDTDYWPWKVMVPGLAGYETVSVPIEIPDVASDSLQIKIQLRGRSDVDGPESNASTDLDDHHITAYLDYDNGSGPVSVLVGDSQWDGLEISYIDEEVSLAATGGAAVDGIYTLRLEADSPNGQMTFSLLNEVDVTYSRAPVARVPETGGGQLLWLHNVARGTQSVSNFPTENIVVVENPGPNAKFIPNTLIELDGGKYKVTFKARADKDYLVYDEVSIKTAEVTRDIPSSLTARNNKADYLIIASRAFPVTVEKLIALRSGNPYNHVQVAWLDDIYEVFGYGRVDPFAITRFVDYATRVWKVSPIAINIVGNGNYDHADRLGNGDSFVPTVMVNTVFDRGDGPDTEGLFVSDYRLVAGDSQLPVSVGRIPILNDAEGANYIARISEYESSTPTIYRTATLLADDADPSAGNFPLNMEHMAVNELEDHLGFFEDVTSGVEILSYPGDAAAPGGTTVGEFRQQWRDEFEHSDKWNKDLVIYDGHGSQSRLADEGLFNAVSAAGLTNLKLPIFSALSCSVGNFARPGVTDLATLMMLPDVEDGTGYIDEVTGQYVSPVLKPGGIIASMVPTGLSYDIDAQKIGTYFVNSLYGSDSTISIGEAAQAAITQTTNDSGLIHAYIPMIYTVIGDVGVRPL